jgi:hypothetical protein
MGNNQPQSVNCSIKNKNCKHRHSPLLLVAAGGGGGGGGGSSGGGGTGGGGGGGGGASGDGVEASQSCLLIACPAPAFCKGGQKESKPGSNTSLQAGLASIPEVYPASLVQMLLVRHMSCYCDNNALSPVAICICVVAFTFMSTSPTSCLST